MLKIACIPAYNEGKGITNVIKKTLKHVDKVVVCDDGSTDDTFQKSKNAGAIAIKHEKNLGKGAAMKSLFNRAKELKADIVVTIDGDGQFLPEEIPKLLTPIIDGRADLVIGNRFDNNSEMPSYRKLGNKVLDKMASMASQLPFKDTQSGFRAYSKKAIEIISIKTDGFGVDSEILVDASTKGLKITEEKVTVLYDTGLKTSTKNPVSHSVEVVSSLIEIIAIRHPLRYLGIPGMILMIIGIAFGVITLATFNQTRYFSIPLTLGSLGTLLVGLVLLLMSVVLFSIGKILRRVS